VYQTDKEDSSKTGYGHRKVSFLTMAPKQQALYIITYLDVQFVYVLKEAPDKLLVAAIVQQHEFRIPSS
jgi:hypothetical protein